MKTANCVRAAVLAASLCVSAPAIAQEKTGNKEGFSLKPGTVRIVLMRPVVDVGEQSTGGMFEPNADWTTQARGYLATALGQAQSKLGNVVVEYSDQSTGDGPLVTQYSHLFNSVADSVIEYQFFPGNRLPTKKRGKSFEWGMGDGLSRLTSLKGADYALFISTHDEYGSTGRKVLQIVGMLGGVGVTSGVHQGYAGLVDLKTGELVWLNADRQMGGDVRTLEGAQKRVTQLLEGFPGRPVEVAAAGN
ncbi:hypothetical protein AB3M93_15745 [Novosphingobium panipatense]|jgi:hypothetical protein|uniref:hypothetical protein n=1 Tax=Novosphingobium TaxID=165696 RepID=UPI000CDB65BB|nr:hypothetical protein [Novosphingobium sp. HII-3]